MLIINMYGSTLYIVLGYTSSPDENTVKWEGVSPIQRKMVSHIPGHKVPAWGRISWIGGEVVSIFYKNSDSQRKH